MTSLYAELNALGFIEAITEIIADYDGDPFGVYRWKDMGDVLRERHKRELAEYNNLGDQITITKLAYDRHQQRKKARERLRMNKPVNDYWSAKAHHNDVLVAYPDNDAEKKQAFDLFSKFKKERTDHVLDSLAENFGTEDTICRDYTCAWVDMDDYEPGWKYETIYKSLGSSAQLDCIKKYGMSGYVEVIRKLKLPDKLNLGSLDGESVINIPHPKGIIKTKIWKLYRIFNLDKIPVMLRDGPGDIMWDVHMDHLIENYREELISEDSGEDLVDDGYLDE